MVHNTKKKNNKNNNKKMAPGMRGAPCGEDYSMRRRWGCSEFEWLLVVRHYQWWAQDIAPSSDLAGYALVGAGATNWRITGWRQSWRVTTATTTTAPHTV